MKLTFEEALELKTIIVTSIADDNKLRRINELINKLATEEEDDRK